MFTDLFQLFASLPALFCLMLAVLLVVPMGIHYANRNVTPNLVEPATIASVEKETAPLPSAITTPIQEEDLQENGGKYQHSLLDDDLARHYLNVVVEAVVNQKMYLNPDLTISMLVEQTGVSRHRLSQVINQKLGKNFNDFVNEYRVEEAKKLLVSPESHYLTNLAIAFEVGFNSKSTFYTVFKKNTGLTPSEFTKIYRSVTSEEYQLV
jgi:AraC-like DNA-binding protein